MELPCQYSYKPRWLDILFVASFFGACSAFMAYKALTNSAGATLNGLIELGPAGATAFYWFIAAIGGVFVLGAGLMVVQRITTGQRMFELGTESFLVPDGGFRRPDSRVAYAQIERVHEVEVSGQRFLYVDAGGLRYTIHGNLFTDEESYREVREFLNAQALRK